MPLKHTIIVVDALSITTTDFPVLNVHVTEFPVVKIHVQTYRLLDLAVKIVCDFDCKRIYKYTIFQSKYTAVYTTKSTKQTKSKEKKIKIKKQQKTPPQKKIRKAIKTKYISIVPFFCFERTC